MSAASATGRETRILVVTPDGGTPDWARGVEGVTVAAEGGPDRALSDLLAGAGAAAVDARVESPLAIGRRIRRLGPGIQLVLVASPDAAEELRRAMTFHPGLGEPWLVTPEEAGPELLERAARISEQRASHVQQLSWLSERVARIQEEAGRARMSDRYLATVLELLPNPVLALDHDDRILFANSAAEALVGPRAEESRARRTLPAVAGLDELLERGRTAPASGRIALGGEGEERVYDASVAAVEGERPVRVLVLHDVTERERLLEERDEALEDLREAMHHRSRFYTSMSHELRTPINAMMGYNNLLLEGVLGELPDQQVDALERIGRSARHLLDLVDDVLDLSKIEAGKLDVERAVVSLPELMADLEATLQHLSDETGSELRFHVDPACGDTVRTDPKRIRQILMNLVSNAIRYGEGEPVDVRCRSGPGTFVVEVEDRGPGIPPERIEEIFEEFVQLGPRDNGGTGLGLPISRTLARLLGGEVTVESEPGRGSTFRLTVPVGGEDDERAGAQPPG